MSKNDGGPAFPSNRDVTYEQNWEIEYGMSLRDYVAARAMQGLLANPDSNIIYSEIAGTAYLIADEMLKEREKWR